MGDTPGLLGDNAEVVEVRRSGWDIAFGVLLVLGALVVFGDVVIATVVSLLVIGWTAVIGGVLLAVGSFGRVRQAGFWWFLVGGVVLVVAGVLLLTNPKVGAFTLTIFLGATFFAGGVMRVVMAFTAKGKRWLFALSGLAGLLIGAWVLFNPVGATLTLLGILLGVEMLVEGITLLVVGRVHVRAGGRLGPPPAVVA